jgi:sugar transferase EpsL
MCIKRLIDVVVSVLGIILLLPLFGAIAFAIWITIGRPIIFRQLRPGLYGVPFAMFKFRTMSDVCDREGQLLPDGQRLTRIGSFMRRTSLDELPELLNVLRGDMSLIGPRPLLMEYLAYYTPEQNRRHEVLPGISGWAQVNGRNAISWQDKFALDVWYVDNWTLWLDLKILWLTLVTVFKREGIHAPDSATMPKFQGESQIGDSRPSASISQS